MQFDSTKYDFILVENEKEFTIAKDLFIEYSASIKIDLCFQDFENELKEINIQYGKPNGGLILIKNLVLARFIGCAGIRKIENEIAELKRMYIQEQFRYQGLGKQLLILAVNLAKDLNYKKLRLDTLGFMKPAIKLYQDLGFKEIGAYRYSPVSGTKCFELILE